MNMCLNFRVALIKAKAEDLLVFVGMIWRIKVSSDWFVSLCHFFQRLADVRGESRLLSFCFVMSDSCVATLSLVTHVPHL